MAKLDPYAESIGSIIVDAKTGARRLIEPPLTTAPPAEDLNNGTDPQAADPGQD